MKKLVLASLVAATSLVSASALAESKKAATIETYDFPDDQLLNVKGATDGMIIDGAHRPVRIILARPRTHFVPELLKTIEGL